MNRCLATKRGWAVAEPRRCRSGSAPESRRRPALGAQSEDPASARSPQAGACTSPPAGRNSAVPVCIDHQRPIGVCQSASEPASRAPSPEDQRFEQGCLGPAVSKQGAAPSAHYHEREQVGGGGAGGGGGRGGGGGGGAQVLPLTRSPATQARRLAGQAAGRRRVDLIDGASEGRRASGPRHGTPAPGSFTASSRVTAGPTLLPAPKASGKRRPGPAPRIAPGSR